MDLTLGKVPYTDPKVQAVFDKWDELVKPGYFLENHDFLRSNQALQAHPIYQILLVLLDLCKEPYLVLNPYGTHSHLF